jgi:hypothetical protein
MCGAKSALFGLLSSQMFERLYTGVSCPLMHLIQSPRLWKVAGRPGMRWNHVRQVTAAWAGLSYGVPPVLDLPGRTC